MLNTVTASAIWRIHENPPILWLCLLLENWQLPLPCSFAKGHHPFHPFFHECFVLCRYDLLGHQDVNIIPSKCLPLMMLLNIAYLHIPKWWVPNLRISSSTFWGYQYSSQDLDLQSGNFHLQKVPIDLRHSHWPKNVAFSQIFPLDFSSDFFKGVQIAHCCLSTSLWWVGIGRTLAFCLRLGNNRYVQMPCKYRCIYSCFGVISYIYRHFGLIYVFLYVGKQWHHYRSSPLNDFKENMPNRKEGSLPSSKCSVAMLPAKSGTNSVYSVTLKP